ncbi:valine--tRNA ligase [Gammaproteobacteria bacterium]|nr:valine--tRNA ligase [Gammaproteobacteria bacterium]
MEKTYNPQNIENKIYKSWMQKKYFAPNGKDDPFCIMIPPPNVTGSLHMGHGLGSTIMDVLVRYNRMQGKNTLWQPGTDHAGIATQMVVERRLAKDGISRQDMDRESFINKIWEWKEESGNTITSQFKRLGISADWDREKFTMDESLSESVKHVFVKLYKEGLIYRGVRLVNWDPILLTAISDLEVINEEQDGNLWHIKYPIVDSKEFISVATTRPETLLGDVAVAVNPTDERFKHLIGKYVHLPLTDKTIPIIADDYVDKDFGSGFVKITPAHDFNDFEIGKRHNLNPINILTKDAKLNENTPKEYQGLDRFVARKKILSDLENKGLLEKTEKHKLKIPIGDRSGAVIEPYLTKQWFMKMESLAKPAIDAVRNGDVKFIPENWNKTYFQWLDNIEDWCISRQLLWGHRIPAWYDNNGNVYVGKDEQEIRLENKLLDDVKLFQDDDVLDTWFSSALWPFSTLGWPNKTNDFNTFYPTSVLVTGFDIIFFWVARMIMMSLKFTGKAPFKEIFITGLIRDTEGHKMSKSKGNIIDPIDLIDGIELNKLIQKRTYGLMQPEMAKKIEKLTIKQFPKGINAYGTDALRFTFCALASFNREISFDINRLEGYRNFCNKLWNATRYVLMNIENYSPSNNNENILSLSDQWIFSRLQKTIESAHTAIANYRFDVLANTLFNFIWNEFCDWYLELSKPILTSEKTTAAELNGTRHTLITVLQNIVLLLHPITPFITEEIWGKISFTKNSESIMIQKYPKVDKNKINEKIEDEINWLKNIIISIRTLRSETNISPSKKLNVFLNKGTNKDKELFIKHKSLIIFLAKLEDINFKNSEIEISDAATTIVKQLEILIPMEGLINKKEEIHRLTKTINKLTKEYEHLDIKLKNKTFLEKAPTEVVKKENKKLKDTSKLIEKLSLQLKKFT